MDDGCPDDLVEDREAETGYYRKEHVDSHLGALVVAPAVGAAVGGACVGSRRREDPTTAVQ